MAVHSSILAWRIPWTEKLHGLHSRGHKESGMTERLTVIRRGFPGGTGGKELTCQIQER